MNDFSKFRPTLAFSVLLHVGLLAALFFLFRTLAGSSDQSTDSADAAEDIEMPPLPEEVAWHSPDVFAPNSKALAEAKKNAIPFAHWDLSENDPASLLVLPVAPIPSEASKPEPEAEIKPIPLPKP